MPIGCTSNINWTKDGVGEDFSDKIISFYSKVVEVDAFLYTGARSLTAYFENRPRLL